MELKKFEERFKAIERPLKTIVLYNNVGCIRATRYEIDEQDILFSVDDLPVGWVHVIKRGEEKIVKIKELF